MFRKLFGKKEEPKEEPKEEKSVLLETDAPKEISEIRLRKGILDSKNSSLLTIHLAATLKDEIEKNGGKLIALAQTALGDKGVLDLPILAELNKKKFVVFVYDESNPKNSKNFSAARDFIKKELKMDSYYYAPKKLNTKAKGGKPLRGFEARDLTNIENAKLEKEYAMWWQSKTNKKFAGSKTQKNLGRIYKALDGINTYVFAAIGRNLDICDKETGRLKLPEGNMSLVVEGPSEKIFILDVSAEKGLRFKFKIDESSERYREKFLSAFADYAEFWKKGAKKNKLSLDEKNPNYNPLGWYNLLEATAKDSKGKDNIKIGLSLFNQ